jgi:hypothetical protein
VATFSITFASGFGSSNSGIPAGNAQMPTAQIDDGNATPGFQRSVMAKNGTMNYKGSDGVTRQAKIDSSRSDPSKGLIYMVNI